MVELDQLPLYEMHTMYYQFWKEKEAESKMSEDEKASAAMGKMIEESM